MGFFRHAILLLAVVVVAGCALVQAAPAPVAAPEVRTEPATPVPPTSTDSPTATPTALPSLTPTPTPDPLTIEYLRLQSYNGGEIQFIETLESGANYSRHYVSYQSEGLTIYALLTIPNGEPPETGWPVIIFNHGYIPPDQYRTTERYVAYVDAFARSGYIVLRPDYRGHDRSEGEPRGAYRHPDYVIDVLNATEAMKKFSQADPQRIGMWGHSMGGYITLRAMVVDPDIRAGVIWAGVVAAYDDLALNWFRRGRDLLIAQYGLPDENPELWQSLSANYYLEDLSGPIQLHHGTLDTSVPVAQSERLYSQLLAAGQVAELYIYPGDNHNLSVEFVAAMGRSLSFFYRHVKGGE